jgi:hypothetical protein
VKKQDNESLKRKRVTISIQNWLLEYAKGNNLNISELTEKGIIEAYISNINNKKFYKGIDEFNKNHRRLNETDKKIQKNKHRKTL